MKQGRVLLIAIIDRSGSMHKIAGDAIGGFNKFLADQKAGSGECLFTLIQFDDKYEVWHDMAPIAAVEELTEKTFVPRGSTAYLDALGRTIQGTGAKLLTLPEDERPERVIVLIVTDGLENASKEYTGSEIRQMIEHQQQTYKWDFLFIGSNQDAIETAKGLGIPAQAALTMNASGQGTQRAYDSASSEIIRARGGVSGQSIGFSDEDREIQRRLERERK